MKMTLKNVLISAGAVAALALVGTACGGDSSSGAGDGGTVHKLSGGNYNFLVNTANANPPGIENNTCWPSGTVVDALYGMELNDLIIEVDSETEFTIMMPESLQSVFPNIKGTKTGNDLEADGTSTPYEVSPTCFMTIEASADGEMTSEDEFDAAIGAVISIAGASGAAPDCSGQTSFPESDGLLPWPQFTNNECTVTINGEGYLP